MNISILKKHTVLSFVAAVVATATLFASFIILEPLVGRAQTSETFTVQQSISEEIAFVASTSVNNLSPSIPGQTGGTANGTAQVAVVTNSDNGFNMTIRFGTSTDHTVAKMQADNTTAYISDYSLATATTVPDYAFGTPGTGQAAEFGFTVNASNTGDIHQNFLDNDTNCGIPSGSGGTYEANSCWMTPTSTAYTIIDRGSATPSGSGSTTTVQFRVAVPSNPNPVLDNGGYTATVTLTATAN